MPENGGESMTSTVALINGKLHINRADVGPGKGFLDPSLSHPYKLPTSKLLFADLK